MALSTRHAFTLRFLISVTELFTIDPRGDEDEGEDNDDADDERCKLQMQSAGWERLLHTEPCPSSHAEGTGPAHYLKMPMNRMINSKMATKIYSMINKRVTKAVVTPSQRNVTLYRIFHTQEV